MKNKILERWKNMDKPSTVEWLVLLAIILFCFVSFNHTDITITATHGKDLIEVIMQGRFFEFYDYTESTAVYLIPIYILFAIWSIPVVLFMKICNIPLWGAIDFDAIGFRLLMWYKLLPSLFYLATALVIYKIGIQIGMSKNKSKWMMFIWVSFPIAMFSQFVFGQYDSICMFFTMCAILFYLKKKYYKFSILMAIAITFKLFPIFIFLPLILLKEKRFMDIVKYILISFSGYILSNMLFMGSAAFSDAGKFNNNIFNRLFDVGFANDFGTLSIFLILIILVCVWAYLKKIDENDITSYNKYTIYTGLFVYTALFACILWHPQWVILLTPFIVISAFQNDNLRLSMLLDIGMSIFFILLTACYRHWKVGAEMISLGIFPKIFGERKLTSNLKDIFLVNDVINMDVFISIFVALLIANVIWQYPRKDSKETKKELVNNEEIGVERSYILMRMFTIFLYIIPTLYIFFK